MTTPYVQVGPTLPTYMALIWTLDIVWLKNTLPTYNLDICSKFCRFFNERKLVLGLLDAKGKVKAKKFKNCSILPELPDDIVSNIRY